MSETQKYRHLVLPYLHGNILDLGSGGSPVVPHAIQVELPEDQFAAYNSGNPPVVVPQWRGSAFDLPFKDATVDVVYSSHLLEDVADWEPVLREWVRVIKPGGHLIIMLPDKQMWEEALRRGQPPNCSHRHEAFPGEITISMPKLNLPMKTVLDELTNCFEGDYNILYVGRKN